MKKIIIIILSIFFSNNLFSQNDANYTARETASLFKTNIYNTARFLSYRGPAIVLDRGMQISIPSLTHTFSLTKNTLIQINQTVRFSTTSCVLCPEAGVTVWIYVDNLVFASFAYTGSNKILSLSGSALAQLGPGTHTIRLDFGGTSNTGDITLYGANSYSGNTSHLSLLFFEQ